MELATWSGRAFLARLDVGEELRDYRIEVVAVFFVGAGAQQDLAETGPPPLEA